MNCAMSGSRRIAPPGQEGWREAPGWLFRRRLLNNHPVCASLEAALHFSDRAATPPVQEGQLSASRHLRPTRSMLQQKLGQRRIAAIHSEIQRGGPPVASTHGNRPTQLDHCVLKQQTEPIDIVPVQLSWFLHNISRDLERLLQV